MSDLKDVLRKVNDTILENGAQCTSSCIGESKREVINLTKE